MYSVLNKLSEYIYFYIIKKHYFIYNFLLVFKNVESFQPSLSEIMRAQLLWNTIVIYLECDCHILVFQIKSLAFQSKYLVFLSKTLDFDQNTRYFESEILKSQIFHTLNLKYYVFLTK